MIRICYWHVVVAVILSVAGFINKQINERTNKQTADQLTNNHPTGHVLFSTVSAVVNSRLIFFAKNVVESFNDKPSTRKHRDRVAVSQSQCERNKLSETIKIHVIV